MESIKMFRAGLCLYCIGDWAWPVELWGKGGIQSPKFLPIN